MDEIIIYCAKCEADKTSRHRKAKICSDCVDRILTPVITQKRKYGFR